jgi:hypothetical protein
MYWYSLSDSLFSFSWKKRPLLFWAAFSRLVVSYSLARKRAERAIFSPHETRRFARRVQVLRETQSVSLRMTTGSEFTEQESE